MVRLVLESLEKRPFSRIQGLPGLEFRRRFYSMLDWLRGRKNGNPQGVTSTGELREEMPWETAAPETEEFVDRTPKEEPADGFSEAGIREALRDVRDPEIGRDLVSLNMVREVRIESSSVTVGRLPGT